MGYADKAVGRREFLRDLEGLVDQSPVKRAGVVKMEGVDLNTTLRRGWCFGTEEFKEKLDGLLGKQISEGNTYRVENGYDGRQLRGHDERAAQEYIESGLSVLGLKRGIRITT